MKKIKISIDPQNIKIRKQIESINIVSREHLDKTKYRRHKKFRNVNDSEW